MKNIIKTLFVMLTSASLLTSANAGELGVSGTAKATYNILTGTHQGKGLGVTNEINFTHNISRLDLNTHITHSFILI